MVGGADERWREAATMTPLTVVPRLWQATWFRLLAVATLIAVSVMGFTLNERRKLRRSLERVEAQQALETERRRIARDLHDDLGAGLAEVVLLGELSRQGNIPAPELPEHVSSMTEKARALVAAMDEIVWTVNPRNDTLKSLAGYLSEHTQRFLASARIRGRVSIPDDLPITPLSAHFRHNVFLAIKEVLHNVAKHSGASEVWFRMECGGGELVLKVEDDGKGFDPATVNGQRNGLENMQSRLQALGGRAEFRSQAGRGTTVVFTLPISEPARMN
jgi:signal transduction histidine kinase